jgi:ABC-type transporter Mla subunit MlaD
MEKTIEQQIEYFSGLVEKCDNAIKGMDAVIASVHERRSALIEKRAQLNSLLALAKQSASEAGSASASASVGLGLTLLDKAIDAGLEVTEDYVERETARIERELEEQKKWKKEHPGKRKE